MKPISNSSWRNGLLLASAIFCGAIGFVAGRFTAGHSPVVANKPAEISSTAKEDRESSARNLAALDRAAAPALIAGLPAGRDEREWQQLLSRPGSPARTAALAAWLEEFASVSPNRAMDLAQAEKNLKLREALIGAALRGWARTSRTNAAQWALALPDANERERAIATVFALAASVNPEETARFGQSLMQQNPDQAVAWGSYFVAALSHSGNFELATRMAAEGGPNVRRGWMAGAYSYWAEFQPTEAGRAAAAIADPELRDQALHGIVGGWAETDPAALVQFVTDLPPDNKRGALLSQSLERWAKHDPEAASNWINDHDQDSSLDEGVAAVATMDSLAPDLAVQWAESVVDPKLRSETLVTVIRGWLTADLPAAARYFEATKNLLPDDRRELTQVFTVFRNESGRP